MTGWRPDSFAGPQPQIIAATAPAWASGGRPSAGHRRRGSSADQGRGTQPRVAAAAASARGPRSAAQPHQNRATLGGRHGQLTARANPPPQPPPRSNPPALLRCDTPRKAANVDQPESRDGVSARQLRGPQPQVTAATAPATARRQAAWRHGGRRHGGRRPDPVTAAPPPAPANGGAPGHRSSAAASAASQRLSALLPGSGNADRTWRAEVTGAAGRPAPARTARTLLNSQNGSLRASRGTPGPGQDRPSERGRDQRTEEM